MKPSQPQQRLALGLGASAAILCSTVLAAAQDGQPAQGTMKTSTASSGSTEVTTGTFDAAKQSTETPDATEAKLQIGALLSTGNARSLASTASGSMRLRRQANELSAVIAANYARSAATPADDTRTTMENYQGKLRYDRFVTQNVSLFLSLSGRRDRFQGLDARLNLDPGLAYYFIDVPKHRLWAELGYDLQDDFRRPEVIAAARAKGEDLDRSEVRHSGRGFLGYDNALSEAFTFDTGVEYLQALKDTENFRLNWDLGITSSIGGNFSIATTLNLRYDHNPLPGVKNTDVTSAVSLVYQLL